MDSDTETRFIKCGSLVYVGGADPMNRREALVKSLHITGDKHTQYEVVWWDDEGSRHEAWLHTTEMHIHSKTQYYNIVDLL